jgi:putative ABC transport system permease protein
VTLRSWWRRIRFTIARGPFDSDLDDEVRLHLELRAEKLRRTGVPADEAARKARRQFGNVTLAIEDSRAIGTLAWADPLRQDLRYAARALRKSPGFTLGAVLALTLGIGANTTIFSVINATLLRPLPFPDPSRLATVWTGSVEDPRSRNIVSLPNYRDWKAQNHAFEDIALFDSAGRGYGLTSHGEPEQVPGLRVTASFFNVLGIPPMLGRTFLPEEEEPGRDRVVVLSHGLWVRRYAADSALIGKTIQIDGGAYTVVGVMPPGFAFQFWGPRRQLWVPAGWTKGDLDRSSQSFVSIARLKAGVTMANARAEMDVVGRASAVAHPEENVGRTVRVVPMSEFGIEDMRAPLYGMLGLVGFVLLIACVNVANLTLARASSRTREMSIRRALGAGRGRLVRQLLTESLLLAGVGGACGLALAFWGTKLSFAVLPTEFRSVPLRPVDGFGIDASVLAFTCSVSIVSGVLFGLAPALAAFRSDVNQPLKEDARGSTGGRSRLRYGLVASEMALTLVVLAAAGATIVSVARLLRVDPGLDPRNVLDMQMALPQENLYYGPPAHPGFCADLDRRVGSVPGVVSVSAVAHLPLGGGGAGRAVAIEGRPAPEPGRRIGAGYSVACPNFLRTLGIRLVAGREFTLQDTASAPGVALVNENMARRFWPSENVKDVVGKRFRIDRAGNDGTWLTVVGVFGDIRQGGLDREPFPSWLRPYSQAAWPSMDIVTKTTSAPSAFVAPVKDALADVEPSQPVSSVRTMQDVIGASVAPKRFPMLLLSSFAILALALAAVGIAGVVGYSVAQRTNEIGVRMALGARASDVLRLVLGQSLSWTLIGVAVGGLASLGLLRFLRSVLFGVTPADPMVLGVVSLLLVVVACGASYLPARRAARIDPVSALRHD